MQLTYKIIVSPHKKSNSYQVQIDGYRYLEGYSTVGLYSCEKIFEEN